MKTCVLNIVHIYYYRRYIQFSRVIKCDDDKYHICPREKVLYVIRVTDDLNNNSLFMNLGNE